MCITLHASNLKSTKIYAGEAMKDDKYVHLLAYKNKATNLIRGGNAMILPIPAVSISQENSVDTTKFKGFLDSITESTKAKTLNKSRSRGFEVDSLKGVSVFDTGSYTVLLANDTSADFTNSLKQVSANKRPELNDEVLNSFAELYPGWAMAICCWDGNIDPEPLLWWYEPKVPNWLFAPTLDAHDGKAPKEGNVSTDHLVSFGSTIKPTGSTPIYYDPFIPKDVRSLLPEAAVGQKFTGNMSNGDFWFATENFTGEFNGQTNYNFVAPKVQRSWPTGSATAEFQLNNWS